MSTNTTFSALLEGFFTERLVRQKRVSAHTVASYRDSCCATRSKGYTKPHQGSHWPIWMCH